jgi:signal transduction histidine kinase
LILVCEPDGTIREVLRAPAEIGCRVGGSFAEHLEAGSRQKFERLLAQVLEVGALAGWEVVLEHEERFHPMQLAAVRVNERVMVVATLADPEVGPILEAMSDMSNEQANALRATEQNLRQTRDAGESFSAGLLEELAAINNELATLQRMLAQKNAALVRVNAQMNGFLGMAAHDLRNPLGVISNYAELLLEDTGDPDQVHGLKAIRHAAKFMQKLVDDLLDSSQLESGRIELALAPVDVEAFVTPLLARMRPFAEAKRIRVTQAPLSGRRRVVADEVRLEQVLVNLLTNAFKFSLPDTSVHVHWDEAPDALAIAVSDHGPGIPPDELDRLFQPFARTSVRATAGETSTGLGLWIARRAVEAQGGRIEVTSEVGRGTTFKVWLRAAP